MGRGRKPAVAPATNGKAETSQEKFVRLAIKRVGALKARARMVKNLAAYDFTEDQKEKVIGAVERIAEDIAEAFRATKATDPNRDRFSF